VATRVGGLGPAFAGFDTAMKQVKRPTYEKWVNYEAFLLMNVERLCHWWDGGIEAKQTHRIL